MSAKLIIGIIIIGVAILFIALGAWGYLLRKAKEQYEPYVPPSQELPSLDEDALIREFYKNLPKELNGKG